MAQAANPSGMYCVLSNEYPAPAAPTVCPFPPPLDADVKGDVAGRARSQLPAFLAAEVPVLDQLLGILNVIPVLV